MARVTLAQEQALVQTLATAATPVTLGLVLTQAETLLQVSTTPFTLMVLLTGLRL